MDARLHAVSSRKRYSEQLCTTSPPATKWWVTSSVRSNTSASPAGSIESTSSVSSSPVTGSSPLSRARACAFGLSAWKPIACSKSGQDARLMRSEWVGWGRAAVASASRVSS